MRYRGNPACNPGAAQLHAVLQIVMGGHDCQAHVFLGGGRLFGPKHAEQGLAQNACLADERTVSMADVLPGEGTQLFYYYQVDEGWVQHVDVVRSGPPEAGARYPCCRAGERAAPPEGVRGTASFQKLLKALARPRRRGGGHQDQWPGPDFDPQAFDVQAVNRRLAALR